jgi:predicted nucleic acid-binding protein
LIVVDTSVALKWVLPEAAAELAKRVLGQSLIAPDVWRVEAANGLRKSVRRGDASESEARDWLSILEAAPVEDVPTATILRQGLDLAMALNHPIYDCLFLALAVDRGCRLLTADATFQDVVAARSSHQKHIVLLSDYFQ